ncbi:MAG: hypothetical protein O6941_08330 [Planctomycetota bacterium]|nr:hypothetical protein [Planctomycetota bacterium]
MYDLCHRHRWLHGDLTRATPPDFDGDGTVGILNLLTLLANWS